MGGETKMAMSSMLMCHGPWGLPSLLCADIRYPFAITLCNIR